jgi:hypothetical protein
VINALYWQNTDKGHHLVNTCINLTIFFSLFPNLSYGSNAMSCVSTYSQPSVSTGFSSMDSNQGLKIFGE